MESELELEHNEHWMCASVVQGIYRAIARQNEICMIFRDKSLKLLVP